MSLNNSQINSILKEYDEKRFRNQALLDERTKEVYIKIPKIKELNEELISGSAEFARKALLSQNPMDISSLTKRNEKISAAKTALLIEGGFPSDYLSPVYDCPKCKDTGYIGNEKCSCFKQAQIRLLYSQSLIDNAIYTQNFSTFDYSLYSDKVKDPVLGVTPYKNIVCVVKTCKSFIKELNSEPSTRKIKNLLIFGNTGVGKTFLSNCIAKDALDNACSVIYITSNELFEIFEKNSFGKDNYDDEPDPRLQNISQCDLLIIDDLGTEFSNRFTNAKLYSCINDRLLKNLPMVISSNLNFKDFRQNYSERIYSRFVGDFTALRIFGDDIRIKNC